MADILTTNLVVQYQRVPMSENVAIDQGAKNHFTTGDYLFSEQLGEPQALSMPRLVHCHPWPVQCESFSLPLRRCR